MAGQSSYSRLAGDDEAAMISGSEDYDSKKLRLLGYKPQLKRNLSLLSNFSVTFSIVSVLTGITTLYGTGLEFGGPVTMVYGWPIAGTFTVIVGLAMAEICSAYPTSGGLYFWSAKLCSERRWGPFASWLTGWFNIVGQWAVTTSVDYSLAQLIQVIILLSTGGANGGGYLASKYVVIAIHAAILLSHAIINSLPISLLSFFGQFAAAWNMLGVFVLMIVVPTVATERASAEFVFTHFNTDNSAGIHSNLYIFVLGLLMSQYTLLGYDASAHMTEETKNADTNGPIGIISAIGISIVVGWGYILGITFAVKDIPSLLSPDNEAGGYAIAQVFYEAFKSRYGSGVGGIVCLGIVAVAIYFCAGTRAASRAPTPARRRRSRCCPRPSSTRRHRRQSTPRRRPCRTTRRPRPRPRPTAPRRRTVGTRRRPGTRPRPTPPPRRPAVGTPRRRLEVAVATTPRRPGGSRRPTCRRTSPRRARSTRRTPGSIPTPRRLPTWRGARRHSWRWRWPAPSPCDRRHEPIALDRAHVAGRPGASSCTE